MSEWSGGALALPHPVKTDETIREAILRRLHDIGITDDIFAAPGGPPPACLLESAAKARAIYTVIREETRSRYGAFESFTTWCRRIGLPW